MFAFGSKSNRVARSLSRKWLLASAAAVFALPALSRADSDRRDRFDRDGGAERRDNDRHDNDARADVTVHLGDRDPDYRREARVWVPPAYRTVTDRRWCEPVYRTKTERVWVPDRYEERVVQFRGGEGRLRTRVERVLVAPGHYETRDRRTCVTEGRWETFDRQELVREGHYETRVERGKGAHQYSPFTVVNPSLGKYDRNFPR